MIVPTQIKLKDAYFKIFFKIRFIYFNSIIYINLYKYHNEDKLAIAHHKDPYAPSKNK